MKRAPTLITRPNLVFLSPTKKVLRSPILKCKIILVSNHMALLQNQPLLCTSISAHHCCSTLVLIIAAQHYCSSQLLISAAHHCFWSLLLISIAHHCWSSLLLIYFAHLYCWSSTATSLYNDNSFHFHTLLMYIIVHLIIHNDWTSNSTLLSLNIRHALSCIIIIGMHHQHQL